MFGVDDVGTGTGSICADISSGAIKNVIVMVGAGISTAAGM